MVESHLVAQGGVIIPELVRAEPCRVGVLESTFFLSINFQIVIKIHNFVIL